MIALDKKFEPVYNLAMRNQGKSGRTIDIEHKAFRKRLGMRIREVRIAAGMTQHDLSEQAGIAGDRGEQVCKYEAGTVEPSLYSAAAIAYVLGVSINDLVGPESEL
jgi:DNA-binding XRE family transcriptional regulator